MAKQPTKRKQPAKPATPAPPRVDAELVDDSALAGVARNLGVSEDEQFAHAVGVSIRKFLAGLAGFFTTAKAMEESALTTLTIARTLTVPTSKETDETMQRFIRKVSADKRQVEEHWKITSLVSQFHRRLTARRATAIEPLDQASRIANDLHNRYVEEERRRVAAEQERVRKEAEERARKEREEELAKLEADRVAAEEASQDLSDREAIYVDAILRGLNEQQAATRAGFRDPLKAAARLRSSAKVQAAIQAKREADALERQKQALAARPIEYDYVEPEIAPAVGKAGVDRSTWSAELLDERALIQAIVDGKHGIPLDVLTINRPVLNDYARRMHELIDRWPGVRAKKTTRVV
jgi:hypothetical protein